MNRHPDDPDRFTTGDRVRYVVHNGIAYPTEVGTPSDLDLWWWRLMDRLDRVLDVD